MSGLDRLCRPAIDIPTLADVIASRAPLKVRTQIMGSLIHDGSVEFSDGLDALHLQQFRELTDAIDQAERQAGRPPL